MTHTSGMDLTSNTTEVTGANLTAREHIRNAIEAQLAWQPDTWFEYNSPSYWVLAEMITRLTGLHYTDHLTERITGPLQLHDTRYETQEEPPERYVPSHGYRSELSESNRMLAYPSGGLVSSAGDLLRFGRCLLNGGALDGVRILRPRSVELLRKPYVKDVLYRGRKTSWGLGWQLGGPGDLRSERTLFQWGASGTAMWVDHDAGLSVVLLTATWLLDWRVYGQIVNAVYGAMPDAPSLDRQRVTGVSAGRFGSRELFEKALELSLAFRDGLDDRAPASTAIGGARAGRARGRWTRSGWQPEACPGGAVGGSRARARRQRRAAGSGSGPVVRCRWRWRRIG